MLFRFPYLLSPFVSWFSSRSLPLYCKFWLQEDSCVPLRFFPAHFAKTLLKKVSCTFIPQGTWYCLFFYPNRTVRKRVLKTQIQSFFRNQTLVKKRLTSLLTNNNSKWKEVNCLKRGKSERPMRDCFKFCIWLVERMGQVFWTKHKAKFSKTMAIPKYSLYWKFLCPTIRGDWYFLLQLSPFETFLARYSPQPSSK